MAITVIIYLTNEEERLMRDMVVNIENWFLNGPYKEKCTNHKIRIANRMRQKLEAAGAMVIPNNEQLIEMYFADENYKTRKQREEEAAIEALKKPKK